MMPIHIWKSGDCKWGDQWMMYNFWSFRIELKNVRIQEDVAILILHPECGDGVVHICCNWWFLGWRPLL